MAAALAGLLLVAALVAFGGGVASAACGDLLTPPCTTTTDVPSTTEAPPTTEAPSTTAAPPTTQAVVQTTLRTTATTAAPPAKQAEAAATTAPPTPTSNPLIVPGPGASIGGSGATEPGATGTTSKKNSDNTGTVVALVIAGLLVVAILLSLLTYRFWRNTRPLVVHPDEAAPETEPEPATTAVVPPATAEVPLVRP